MCPFPGGMWSLRAFPSPHYHTSPGARSRRTARSSCLARYNVYVTGRSLSTVKTAPVGTLSVIFAGGGPGARAWPCVAVGLGDRAGGTASTGRGPRAAGGSRGSGAGGKRPHIGKRHGNYVKYAHDATQGARASLQTVLADGNTFHTDAQHIWCKPHPLSPHRMRPAVPRCTYRKSV